jgi:glycosyltransferase involved in cell wall biosynthesis
VDIPNPAGTMTIQDRHLSVCYFGTYRQEYSRNQIMIEGLRQAGVDVIECHEQLWRGIEDRVQAASGGWLRPAFIWRVLRTYWHLLGKYRRLGDYDVMVVGYPGHLDVYLARLLTWLRRKPLVWDIFMSVYLVALERGLDKLSRFTIDLLYCLEWFACRLPDRLILDTSEYVAWFGKTHGVPSQRFRLVPTGADDRVFHPIPSLMPDSCAFQVIYYGTFIRNHGVEYIVEAARLLAEYPDIQFELIGEGPEREKAQDITHRYGLKNIIFVEWLEKSELVKRVARADVCLGAFGTTPQSLMTVQNKIYEGLAMAKPVITGDSPAVRQALTHGEHIYLCERENPQSLAAAICNLQSDTALRERLASSGRQVFTAQYIILHLGQLFARHLEKLARR